MSKKGQEKNIVRKRFLKSISFFLLVLILTSVLIIRCGSIYVHKVEEYQNKVQTAILYIRHAIATEAPRDIDKAKREIVGLNKKDRKKYEKKIVYLEKYMVNLKEIQHLVIKFHDKPTEGTLKKIDQYLKFLDAFPEKDDKKKIIAEIQNDKKRLIECNEFADKKLIALTFDDGPNPETTPILLNTLQKENINSTFFVLGSEAQKYPELIKKEAQNGHEVATHTWDHQDLLSLSPEEQRKEITQANSYVNQLTGKNVKIFRPPYGNYDNLLLEQTDLTAINWTVDTNDWRYRSSEPVVEEALTYAHDGAIILMHDIHSWSVAAVPEIISELKQQGYTFVTVGTLMDVRSNGVKEHEVYFGE